MLHLLFFLLIYFFTHSHIHTYIHTTPHTPHTHTHTHHQYAAVLNKFDTAPKYSIADPQDLRVSACECSGCGCVIVDFVVGDGCIFLVWSVVWSMPSDLCS